MIILDAQSKLYSIEAEQAILASLIMYNDSYYRINELMNSSHFYEPVHGRLYLAIEEKISNKMTADSITLAKQFDDDCALKELGGSSYIIQLTNTVPNTLNLKSYAKTVVDFARRRGLLENMLHLQEKIYDDTIDIEATIAEVQGSLNALEENSMCVQAAHSMESLLGSALSSLDAITSGKVKLNLTSTGLRDLDSRLGGWGDTDLIIIAARPGMGKTSLALHHLYHGAKALQKENKSVVFFSLEMGREQLVHKLLAMESGVAASRMRTGDINPDEFQRVYRGRKNIPKNIIIDDTGGLHVNLLRARCKTIHRKQNLGLIIVDYLQLLKGTNSRNRVDEITEISGMLKTIAKENNCPVIALSQLSRGVESRVNKRPILSDLRDSGSIEQDADVVIFIYREEYYLVLDEPNQTTDQVKHTQWNEMMQLVAGQVELNVAKFRHGAVGVVRARFEGKTTKFYDK